MLIDSTIIIVFLIANLMIGYLSSKRITHFGHFSVGNRSFSSLLIFCTLSATFIGGGYTIGNAGKVYSSGMVYAFALLGFSLKEILVASFIAPRMDKYNDCHSVGDMVEKTYGTKAKLFTGVLSLIVCGGILGAQVGALSAIIQTTLSINPTLGALIGLAVLLIYASLGGMRAVVFTDTFQFLILIVGIPLTFFIGLSHVGGWQHVVKTVPHDYLHFLETPKQITFFILLFITFIFGETLVPPYVQRLFMAKSAHHTFKGTLASGLVSIPIFIICGAIGLVAYTYDQQLNPNDAFGVIVNDVLPVGLKGFVIAALLSIILSSAAGFLNAASISFVNDIVKPLKKNQDTDLLKMARLSTVIVGIISIAFALSISNVLDILLAAYNFWSPIILVPLVAAVYDVKSNGKHFFIAAICGITGSLFWEYGLNTPLGLSPILFGIACNLASFMLTHRMVKNTIT
jgi:solute:Na+ symporter, SSS family